MEKDRVSCPQCGSSFNKMFLTGKQGNCETCPMCGAKLQEEDEHPDWITWWYYKSVKYGDYSLWDKPPLYPEQFELVQEFKAPPKSKCGPELDEVKRILRTYVPGAFAESPKPTVSCPWCGSSEYTLLNRGHSLFTGFLGSGKVKRVCNKCKLEF